MEKKIPVKTLYLLLVISIGLIGLGIGSTYALFTTSAEISNPITFNSNLTYTGDVMETIEVTVPAGELVSSTLNITNSSDSNLNYVVWYLDEGESIGLSTKSGNPTGSLEDGDTTSVVVNIFNSGDTSVIVTLGVSSSSGGVVLGSNMLPIGDDLYNSDNFTYDNSNTGLNCNDVTCMLDYLYDLVG